PLHPGPCAKGICASARTTGYGGDHTGLPCAVVLRLIRDLLGEPSRLPPSPPRSFQLRLDLAPELRGARTTRFRRPPPCHSSSAHPRPPHPRLTSRDVRETPLRKAKRDATHIRQIRISVNRNLFARRD